VHVGLRGSQLHRCAEVLWESPRGLGDLDPSSLTGEAQMVALGYVNPPGYSSVGVVNTRSWRTAQVPSTNTHATAAGIAAVYAALLEPGRFCPVLGEETTFGLGFKPTSPHRRFGPNEGSFGHFGTGGAVGFADPVGAVAFGYAMNHVIPRWQSTRNRALIDAVYASLG
jgi:CubicO group peptidase (beta-lactamase class C family)